MRAKRGCVTLSVSNVGGISPLSGGFTLVLPPTAAPAAAAATAQSAAATGASYLGSTPGLAIPGYFMAQDGTLTPYTPPANSSATSAPASGGAASDSATIGNNALLKRAI